MSQSKTNNCSQNRSQRSPAVLVAILGLSAFVLYRASNTHGSRDIASESSSRAYEYAKTFEHEVSRQPVNIATRDLSQLDFFLKQAHQKQQLQAIKTELENNESAPAIDQKNLDDLAFVDLTKSAHSLDLQNEKTFEHVMNDIEEARPVQEYVSPEQEIQSQVKVQRFNADYDRAYTKRYVQQFKENALRAGYKVQIDNNLQIVGVQRVRPNAQQPLNRAPQSLGSTTN